MTMRSQHPPAQEAAARPVAYDSPEVAIEEIFGPSVTGEGYEPGAQGGLLVADLRDVGEALVLQLEVRQDARPPKAGRACNVIDMAEADRIINTWLKARPGWRVERAGDGWITHSE
jgi:hypothetical protein